MRAPKIAGFASLFLLNHKNVIQNTFKSSEGKRGYKMSLRMMHPPVDQPLDLAEISNLIGFLI